jgi:hypothetical protein
MQNEMVEEMVHFSPNHSSQIFAASSKTNDAIKGRGGTSLDIVVTPLKILPQLQSGFGPSE